MLQKDAISATPTLAIPACLIDWPAVERNQAEGAPTGTKPEPVGFAVMSASWVRRRSRPRVRGCTDDAIGRSSEGTGIIPTSKALTVTGAQSPGSQDLVDDRAWLRPSYVTPHE
jgi:hypothetical protein